MNLFLVKLYNLLTPLVAFANHPEPGQTGAGPDHVTNPTSGGNVENIPIEFTNPLGGGGTLGGINSIGDLIAAILQLVLTIGIPLIVLAIIYTGFLFVKAMGDKAKIEEARQAFTWTIVGAIILLASFVIAEAIDGTIQQIINAT